MAYWEEEAKEYAIMDTSLYGPPGFYPEIFWEPTKWLRDKQAWLERKWEEHLNKQKEQQQK
jgi:hypothetical protein